MMRFRPTIAGCAAALLVVLSGCASTGYQLTLMPRSSGKIYYGDAVMLPNGREAGMTVTIEDQVYNGTWVETIPDRATGFVSGGYGGWGWRHGGIGFGTSVTVENPAGGEAKALLRTAEGAGMRCDLRGMGASRNGGGTCQDDKGVVYDVQIRMKETK